MSEVERITRQLKGAWHGPAWHGPALYEVLKDLTAAQAGARPLREAHTIAEIVRHVAVWERVAVRRACGEVVKPTDAEDWPPTGVGDGAWQRALAELAGSQRELLEALARLADADLERPAPGGGYTLGFMLDGVVDHDLYHAGQIALLRKAG